MADDDVDAEITALRQRFGTLVGVDRAAVEGDFVSIDLKADIDGEEIDAVTGVSYEIGSKNMLEGLDEALVGMSAGETKTFTAPLAGGDREGQDAEVTVTVQSVKERELPELDDDFAQLASEFDTLDELTADIRGQVERAKKMQQGVQARDKVLDALLEAADIPVPPALVEAEVHSHLENEGRLEDDEHRAEVSENATKALQAQFLLDAIVEQEKVSVTQPELVEYLVMSAQQYGMSPDAFAKAVDEAGQVQAMVAEVARRKALAVALEQATVTDESGNTVDLEALRPQADEVADRSSRRTRPRSRSPTRTPSTRTESAAQQQGPRTPSGALLRSSTSSARTPAPPAPSVVDAEVASAAACQALRGGADRAGAIMLR